MKFSLFIVTLCLTLAGCGQIRLTDREPPCCLNNNSLEVTVLGYGTKAKYKNLSESEQILMAMRDAKEDAYRNLLERVGVVSLNYTSKQATKKGHSIENNKNLTFNVAGKLQGVRLIHLIPLEHGIYEAKLQVDLDSALMTDNTRNISAVSVEETDFSKKSSKSSDTSNKHHPRHPFSYFSE